MDSDIHDLKINPDHQKVNMPSTSVGIERNLLGVPTFVLNPNSARKLTKIVHEWVTKDKREVEFSFVRDPDVPFPTITHAIIFDAMLAMFAHNFRKDGILYFRISDILRILGRPIDGGAYRAVKEAIRRYAYTTAHWVESWKTSSGGNLNWHGTLLVGEDLWKRDDKTKLKANPRNSNDVERWHSIKFHEKIVESVGAKFTRIFATKVLSLDVSLSAKAVYRYFYGFTDQEEIYRNMGLLQHALNYTDRADRFEVWLSKALAELKECGLVDSWNINKSAICVKCAPLKDARKTTKRRDKKANPKTSIQLAGLFHSFDESEGLFERYESDKAAGTLDPGKVEIIDILVSRGFKEQYEPAIKRLYTAKNQTLDI